MPPTDYDLNTLDVARATELLQARISLHTRASLQKQAAEENWLQKLLTQAQAGVGAAQDKLQNLDLSDPATLALLGGGAGAAGGMLRGLGRPKRDRNVLADSLRGALTGAGLAGGGALAYNAWKGLNTPTTTEKIKSELDNTAQQQATTGAKLRAARGANTPEAQHARDAWQTQQKQLEQQQKALRGESRGTGASVTAPAAPPSPVRTTQEILQGVKDTYNTSDATTVVPNLANYAKDELSLQPGHAVAIPALGAAGATVVDRGIRKHVGENELARLAEDKDKSKVLLGKLTDSGLSADRAEAAMRQFNTQQPRFGGRLRGDALNRPIPVPPAPAAPEPAPVAAPVAAPVKPADKYMQAENTAQQKKPFSIVDALRNLGPEGAEALKTMPLAPAPTAPAAAAPQPAAKPTPAHFRLPQPAQAAARNYVHSQRAPLSWKRRMAPAGVGGVTGLATEFLRPKVNPQATLDRLQGPATGQ